MPSKEYEALVEKVAKAIHEALVKRGAVPWDKFVAVNPSAKELKIEEAQAAISTIRAALQEPNEAMKDAWDLDTGRWISEEIEDPYHPWRVMLAASALGEQSE